MLHLLSDMPLIISNIFSYGVGLISAYIINRYWTFADSTHKTRHQFMLSILLGYIGLVLNTIIIWALQGIVPIMLAKCVAVIIILFYNYFSNKWLVFKVRH
jgi:putative flippase GtrA